MKYTIYVEKIVTGFKKRKFNKTKIREFNKTKISSCRRHGGGLWFKCAFTREV